MYSGRTKEKGEQKNHMEEESEESEKSEDVEWGYESLEHLNM